MVGRNSSDNRFGVSPFIVGETLGDGCNYAGGTGLQQALDDCFAAGGGVVYIRSSTTPYVVNLTLRPHVDLVACNVDGRPPSPLAHVAIQGQHTLTAAGGGFFEVLMNQIFFVDPTFGDLFTVTPTGGAFALIAFKYCGLTSDSGVLGVGRCVVGNPDGASAMQIVFNNSQVAADLNVIESIGAGFHFLIMEYSDVVGRNDVVKGSTGVTQLELLVADLTGSTNTIEDVSGGMQMDIAYSYLESSGPVIHFGGGGAACIATHNTFSSNNGSGFYVDGTGTFTHGDSLTTGTAHDIDPLVTAISYDWQPYAQAGASASPLTVAPRGTAAFDSTQFTLTNGFVQITAPGALTWVDQPGLATVNANQGNFNTSVVGNALTLPVAPVQGDTCAFKCTNAQLLTINSTAPQTLQVGNQTSIAGGSMTSSQIGDATELTFYAAGNMWIANSIIGAWVVV